MTWTFKHTRSDRPMIAEYLCPVHGRFELTVARDADGNPPDEMPCGALATPESVIAAFQLNGVGRSDAEYLVGHHFDSTRPTYCGMTSPFAISKPGYAKVKNVEAVRGNYEKPARETYTNTENIGEGQSLEDWEDDRAKVWERHREAEVYKMTKEL